MISCIIVDDEKHARDEIRYHLNNITQYSVLDDFDNGVSALEYLKNNTVDVVFLDITMIGLDGIETAKKIVNSPLDHKPYIVFVTAYNEYAVEAFELNAIDYILKPINEKRFLKCINRINDNVQKNRTQLKSIKNLSIEKSKDQIISLSKAGAVYPVRINEIKLVYIEERTLVIETTKGKFYLNTSLSDFKQKLEHKNFFQGHRSYIFNIKYIEKIIPWFNSTYKVKLKGVDIDVPISRNKTSDFKDRMSII